ncbi:hypothetical protein BURMUCF2_A0850 [Burkholderia multivorans CF2]|nr:hypothetical protein BURMUCF2_A0850 [Burkholderia multivorans CF2]
MCTHTIESGKDERTTLDPRCAADHPTALAGANAAAAENGEEARSS